MDGAENPVAEGPPEATAEGPLEATTAEGPPEATTAEGPLEALAAARAAADALERSTHELVQRARAAGHTWQEIGQVLAISRQAAHQRFAERPLALSASERDAILARAGQIFEQLADGEWDKVTADWSEAMYEGLGVDGLKQAWRQIVSTVGPLLAIAEGTATRKGPFRIVESLLAFEQGPMKGRVAFTPGDRIAGLFVLLPDAP